MTIKRIIGRPIKKAAAVKENPAAKTANNLTELVFILDRSTQ